MILITYSDWMQPSEALEAAIESGVPFPRDENDDPVHFQFNNHSLEKYDKTKEKAYKTNWENGIESMKEFFQALDRMETQGMRMSENVMRERQNLETCIQGWEDQIKVVEMKQNALKEVRKTLEEHKEDMKKNNNFQYKKKNVVMKKKEVLKPANCCSSCETVCHYPCTFVSNLNWCDAMKSKHCTVCPGKCSYKVHVKGHTIYVPEYEESIETFEDLKKASEGIIVKHEQVMSNLDQESKDAEHKKTSLVKSCIQCIIRLRELALKFDSDSTNQSIRRLIDMLKKNNDMEKVEMLQKILEKTV